MLLSLGMFARGRDARPGEEGPNLLRGGVGGIQGYVGSTSPLWGQSSRAEGPRVETPFGHHPLKPRLHVGSCACGPLSALPLIPFAADTGVARLPLASTLCSPEKPLGAS